MFVLALLFGASSAWAQGTIRATVIDSETGEALIGSTVIIEGTTVGGATDLDGKTAINNLDAGTYTLIASYVSYQTQKIEGVEVKDGDVTVLNIRLQPESIGLEEIVVTAEALKDNEAALLTMQRKAGLVLDGISSAQFSKVGDSDAASAIRRVTGISVEGGKYVYVRGLGDRYSKTTLNNAEIPGLDPNRNTVQMDLFPTNMIENMVVYKTFSPELPGSFTGGFVNIETKDFPDEFTMQLSGSLGYNSNATFNADVLTHDLGDKHWLAYAPDSRSLPAIAEPGIVDISFSNQNRANLLDQQTKAFNQDFSADTYSPFLNHKAAFSIGNQHDVFGKKLGYLAGVSYQREFEYYDNGKVGRYLLPGTVAEDRLEPIYEYDTDIRAKDMVLWGALFNTSLRLSDNHKIGFNLIRNQSAEGTTRYLEGQFPYASGVDPNFIIENRSQEYVQRSFTSYQLKGDHVFGASQIRVDWIGALTDSEQSEPDLRYFNNLKFRSFNGEGEEQFDYDAESNNVRPTSHYFRNLDEQNYDAKVNVEIPFQHGERTSKIKFGGSYLYKQREFTERILQYRVQNEAERYQGDIDAYFSDSNLGLLGTSSNGTFEYGLVIRDETTAGGSYDASQMLPSAYGMIDFQLSPKTKLVAGARYEMTDIEIVNENAPPSERIGNVETNDILPAINVTHNMQDNMNLRFGYGRTLARPTFRELARFQSFDFQGDFILIGNPNLDRTIIDNVDLRWELFPGSGEIVSVSAFYKRFQDPIERAIDPNTNDIALQVVFRNVPEAYLLGGELEVKKNLEFLSPDLMNFSVGGNFTYVYSRVDIQEGELNVIRVNDPDASAQRVMFGQSPYIINGYLNYNSLESRTNVNLSYNVSGQRLSVVSTGGTPNVFEQPRPQLDFKIIQGFNDHFSIDFSAQNLLDSPFKLTQEFKGTEYIYQSYSIGRTYSIGLAYKF